ncbi:hypothetical protein FD754_021579 [Muntiacus muntjak]|uniref:Uncharacterized protein n=1 Tax=Muntiacus muntjak TaxID=9888 RepID=A0A5N3V670_MUNMU|nr:hypothetical protein FD754_021579 [Muntiacus muntjak]
MQDPWIAWIPWRRRWQPTPVILPGEFHEQRSLAGYSPWDCKNPLQYSCLENPHGQRSLAGYNPWGRKESDVTDPSQVSELIAGRTEHVLWRLRTSRCRKGSVTSSLYLKANDSDWFSEEDGLKRMSKKWKEFSGKFYLKHDAVRLTGAKQSPQFPGSGHLEAVGINNAGFILILDSKELLEKFEEFHLLLGDYERKRRTSEECIMKIKEEERVQTRPGRGMLKNLWALRVAFSVSTHPVTLIYVSRRVTKAKYYLFRLKSLDLKPKRELGRWVDKARGGDNGGKEGWVYCYFKGSDGLAYEMHRRHLFLNFSLTSRTLQEEKQQLEMLDELKEIQKHFEMSDAKHKRADLQITKLTQHAEEATKQAEQYLLELQQSEGLRQEAEKRREELKLKAQESIRQWKLKHKKLERALEKQSESLDQLSDKNNQILKERDELKSQLYAALQQIESLRKELNDVLTKRALQEEELHCKEQKLSDVKSHQADLELEVKDSLDTIHRLESELKKQNKIQSQLKAEKAHLEEQIAELKESQAKDKAQLLEMQEAIKNLSAIRADLANKLAEEQRARKEVLKNLSDLRTEAKSKDEETATIITQLKLERNIHQRELEDLTSSLQSVKTKHEQNIQELMKHFKKEKSEAENHIRTLKEKHITNEEEHRRRMEEARLQLKDQLLCLETEQESILGVIGKEIDAACKTFSRDSMDKLKVFSSSPDINYDPHRWLAESKTKLQWLCEELRERESRERSLRQQLMLCRQQLTNMTENKEAELQCLFEQIERQEQLLEEIHREKREKAHRILTQGLPAFAFGRNSKVGKEGIHALKLLGLLKSLGYSSFPSTVIHAVPRKAMFLNKEQFLRIHFWDRNKVKTNASTPGLFPGPGKQGVVSFMLCVYIAYLLVKFFSYL